MIEANPLHQSELQTVGHMAFRNLELTREFYGYIIFEIHLNSICVPDERCMQIK